MADWEIEVMKKFTILFRRVRYEHDSDMKGEGRIVTRTDCSRLVRAGQAGFSPSLGQFSSNIPQYRGGPRPLPPQTPLNSDVSWTTVRERPPPLYGRVYGD